MGVGCDCGGGEIVVDWACGLVVGGVGCAGGWGGAGVDCTCAGGEASVDCTCGGGGDGVNGAFRWVGVDVHWVFNVGVVGVNCVYGGVGGGGGGGGKSFPVISIPNKSFKSVYSFPVVSVIYPKEWELTCMSNYCVLLYKHQCLNLQGFLPLRKAIYFHM